ncbi:MAG: glycine cleavage system protein T [Chromatiales bacterium 21-64-14]|nr:MAG: glycine cleavage system protein T [Chromatiales bacterium 21-64-14]HQU15791.1 glycine cleavage system aminomethyltransferase GcvT [Gammaproteobacteria bacterium]
MGRRTALYPQHLDAGARMVDFGGWDMPLHYGSQIDEHHQVRRDAGMFDVSHMAVLDLEGAQTRPFLRHLLANDVNRLKQPGKALYACMLNEKGGVIDDLIVYFLTEHHFRIVVNAATRDTDRAWIEAQGEAFGVRIQERGDVAMIAIQGPGARAKTHALLPAAVADPARELAPFHGVEADGWFVARTGYTGEDGFEVILPTEQASDFWGRLRSSGVAPCGLGARDTLRLEAGLNLYGADMDAATTPLESGLGWTVAWDPPERAFIGRAALTAQQSAPHPRLVGLVLQDKGVLRNHQRVLVEGGGAGEVTSGGYSPTLSRAIAYARVPAGAGGSCRVEIRGKLVPARIVKPPFVRNGKPCVATEFG